MLADKSSVQQCIAKSGADEHLLNDRALLNLCTKFELTNHYCPTFGNALNVACYAVTASLQNSAE
jgi:hypothetical protein